MSSDIEDLKRELDIVDVISDYIHLERAGTNFKANCPFHSDKTPSFYVSPSKQIFKCFGCGAGGDAIKFVSLYENLSYLESARHLARKYGIKVRIRGDEGVDSAVLSALEEVADFYHQKLKDNREAVDYLKSRNIDSSIIKRFRIGYSPSSGELVKFLKDRGILEAYEKTGNIKRIDESKFRDLFQRRIVIPIRDQRGRVVGFGGRILGGDGPKYINSPESPLFKKRSLLFGFYEGLAYIRDSSEVLIAEGYFDVISLHQAGFRNAVAPLGTAFGRDHAKVLSRIVKKAYLLFDQDPAGRKAMRSALTHLLKEGISPFPVNLPEGMDPHDFLKAEGKDALKEKISASKEVIDQHLERIEGGENTEELIKEITFLAGNLKDKIKAFSILNRVSRLTGIPHTVLIQSAENIPDEDRDENGEPLTFTEKVFLKGLLQLKPVINLDELNLSPRAREIAKNILDDDPFDVPQEVLTLKLENPAKDFSSALEHLKITIEVEDEGRDLRDLIRMRIRTHKGGWFRNPRRGFTIGVEK